MDALITGFIVYQEISLASYPGLLTPVFVTCSTNAGEGLVKLIMCNDIPGRVEEWHILGKTKLQVSEGTTDRKH